MALIDEKGWLRHPLFVRVDGHPAKVYSQPNTGANGLAFHSIVGEEPDFADGIPNRFLSDEREPSNPSRFSEMAAASCMFILRKRMPHVVMYPVTASTWTSGGPEANTTTWAMEAEGGLYPVFGEMLTEHQIQGVLVIATAWEQYTGRKLTPALMREHRVIAIDYGYKATACASGRYSEAQRRLAAGERATVTGEDQDDMTRAEIEALIDARIKLALAIDNNDDVRVASFRKLLDLAVNGGPGAFTDAQGNPLPLVRDNALVEAVKAIQPGGIAPGTKFTVEVVP